MSGLSKFSRRFTIRPHAAQNSPRPMLGAVLGLALATLAAPPATWAQDTILARGDLVVTGFSGIRPGPAPLAEGANPLDEFFIDLDGASAQIQAPTAVGEPPQGQLLPTVPKLRIKASQVGQVNAIALDDGLEARTPNIYLGATAAYGLNIVIPDADGDGAPERIKKGMPKAEWMAGQFGPVGAGPGSIWKVDGRGTPELFATLPGNSGPGIGDIVFDRPSRQLFASSLDDGMIYRLGESGEVIDSFDHGTTGRTQQGLGAVADDGSQIDITNAAFDAEQPDTWAFTQPERRVHGLAVRDGRLYYAAAAQIWSVGISASGFAGDARFEFDAKDLTGDGPIGDMLFDGSGRLYLAQRGAQRASYDYSVFANPEKSNVLRYRRDEQGNWIPEPETYAIGLPPEHTRAEGGIALGYAHDEYGALRTGACGAMLWSTGHRLRAGEDIHEATSGETPVFDVHGLQGNDVALVQPQNTPPQQSYFIDYDGMFGDAAKSGHVGDVEIWQPCEGAPDYASIAPSQIPPGFLPPGSLPPPWYPPPPPPPPPHDDYETNLKLKKRATPKQCAPFFGGFLCRYTVRVTNTGPDAYFGPIVIRDWLPANPPGAGIFANWPCWIAGTTNVLCWQNPVFLPAFTSTTMTVFVTLPGDYDKCHVRNSARIEWAPGGSIWNTDPTDDMDSASSIVPDKDCKDDPRKTDIKIYKDVTAVGCFEWGGGIRCVYRVFVENQGPGPYNANIVVEDTIPNGTSATMSAPVGTWNTPCPNVGNVYTCTHPGASLPLPGDDTAGMIVRVDLSKAKAKELGCKVENKVKITFAPTGNLNTDPTNDEASATAIVPAQICDPPVPKESNLKITKIAPVNAICEHVAGSWCRAFKLTVTNTGPFAFNGNIKLTDTPSVGSISFIGGAGWTCVGNACQTNAAVALQKNPPSADETSVHVTVSGTGAEAQAAGCKLTNTATITDPLGFPENLIAADDTDQITVDLPPEFCQVPVPKTNLKLEKQVDANGCLKGIGVFHCYYNVIVTNTGPGDYNDKIVVDELLPPGTTGVYSWPCVGNTCTKPAQLLKKDEKVVMGVQLNVPFGAVPNSCEIHNTARISYAAGGSDQNMDATDDMDSADAPVVGDPDSGVCVPPYGPTCPPGFTWNGKECDRNITSCKSGWTKVAGSGKCCPPGKPWNRRTKQCGGDDTPPPPECPTGMTATPIAGKCCPRGEPWNPRTKQCGEDDTPPPTGCKPGWTSTPIPGKCCPRGEPWNPRTKQCGGDDTPPPPECPTGMTATPIAGKCCPRGEPWNRKLRRCGGDDTPPPPPPVCPPGLMGTPPNCTQPPGPQCKMTARCLNGLSWSMDKCACVCAGDRVMKRGKCVADDDTPPPVCPKGMIGTPPNCKPKSCPPGMVGFYPRCKKDTSGDPPKICPPGTRGKYPRCKKIEEPPKFCPPGTRGKYPHCKKVEPPKMCPPGTRGRYPRCKKIVVPCPPGTFGKPPRCRAIKLIRPHRPPPGLRSGPRPPRLMLRPNFGGRGQR